MDFGLKGKRAIVTGGSGGIGCASALELAREGQGFVSLPGVKGFSNQW